MGGSPTSPSTGRSGPQATPPGRDAAGKRPLPALQAAFRAIGHQLPDSGPPTSCRRRSARPCSAVSLRRWCSSGPAGSMHTRIVWRGGETTTLEVPVAVGALTDLPTAPQMAQQMRGLFAEGKSDDEMARQLTQHGSRSPSQPSVLPSTVKGIRLTLGLMQQRSQSHPRTDHRVPDRTATGQGVGHHPPLGVSPDQARHGRHHSRCRHGALSVSRYAADAGGLSAVTGGTAHRSALLSSASPPSQTRRGSGEFPEGASAPRRSHTCGGRSRINTSQ